MTELSLAGLLQEPHALGLSLRAPLFLLLLVAAGVFVWRAGSGLERFAAALRSAALTFLALGLAGMALTTSSRPEPPRTTLIAAVDVSESIDAGGRAWALDFVNDVVATLKPSDKFGLVVFANDARVVRPPTEPAPLEELPVPVVRSGTDIGQGVEAALALLPSDQGGRVLLVSDGNETRGNVRRKVPHAQRTNAMIFTAVPPLGRTADVGVEKVAVPVLVTEGSVFPVRVVARASQAARPADLALSLDGERTGHEGIDLLPGINALEIPYRLTGRGSHRLRVRLETTGDGQPGNDYRDVTIMVTGPPRVLFVTSNKRSPLGRALVRKDVTVEIVAPQALPRRADAFLEYHGVVAENLAGVDLPAAAAATLEQYVRQFGGGLVFAAGKRSFGDSRLRRTALARLLPVTLQSQPQPKPTPAVRGRNPLALMLLIDRSNSMGYSTHLERGGLLPRRDPKTSKLHYAKAAALAVIRQLTDEDYLGVIAFDSESFPLSPLQPLKQNRDHLESVIPMLAEDGGTDFYEALELARDQLGSSPVSKRHVILLTDGDTNRTAADHYPLIAELEGKSISVTNIRIGDDMVNMSMRSNVARDPANLALLKHMSSKTGGSFYHVKSAEALPQLMLRDARAAQSERRPVQPPVIRPQVGKASQLLRGIEGQFPPLAAYAVAKSKPRADTPLYVSGGTGEEPILASWQYGLGRVVAFTADPATDAAGWVGWPAYSKFWSQIVRWVMREQTPWDYAFDVRRRDGELTLVVRAFGAEQDGVLFARLHRDEEETEELTLAPVGPQVYEAELPELEGGRYAVTVLRRVGERDVNERTEMVSVPGEDEEPQEEFQTIRPNTSLLEQVALETGGKFNPSAEEVVVREVEGSEGGVRRRYELDFLLIPLAMACFLADVAVRRIWIVRDA